MACNMRETKIKLFYDKSKIFALSLIRFDILRGKKSFSHLFSKWHFWCWKVGIYANKKISNDVSCVEWKIRRRLKWGLSSFFCIFKFLLVD